MTYWADIEERHAFGTNCFVKLYTITFHPSLHLGTLARERGLGGGAKPEIPRHGRAVESARLVATRKILRLIRPSNEVRVHWTVTQLSSEKYNRKGRKRERRMMCA